IFELYLPSSTSSTATQSNSTNPSLSVHCRIHRSESGTRASERERQALARKVTAIQLMEGRQRGLLPPQHVVLFGLLEDRLVVVVHRREDERKNEVQACGGVEA